MTVEDALVAKASDHLVRARLTALIHYEVDKGCRPEISLLPVCLEPPFVPIQDLGRVPKPIDQARWTLECPINPKDLVRLRILISPNQRLDWIACELFLKQIQHMAFRVGFEVAGNKERIFLRFLCCQQDIPVIKTAFGGVFNECVLAPLEKDPVFARPELSWSDIVFRDYFPPPPYCHLLTRPLELRRSPLQNLFSALSDIDPPAVGIYQALFESVSEDHNWHQNVETLLDIEYACKSQGAIYVQQRYAQQVPSGDLKAMAMDVENKAHNDKPFFATALRLAVVGAGEKGGDLLRSVCTFVSLFQHGGRPLEYVTHEDYRQVLSLHQIRDMFNWGISYRPGFIVNSLELTGPVNMPQLPENRYRIVKIESLNTLPVLNPEFFTGTRFGKSDYNGNEVDVCIPDLLRTKHTHLIGRPGQGKSTTQEHLILSDIEEGHGVAVLDPHGDLIRRILCLIPEKHVDRTIYFDPGDSEWVPVWNPLLPVPGLDLGRMADDLVRAISSFVARSSWGDRMENILRHLFFALMHLPGPTLLKVSNLLRVKSEESKGFRDKIIEVLDNETARQFWKHDYLSYTASELSPPKNKLSKILVSGTMALMLSQPESRFNFREIMDEGKILLINLANIGVQIRGILGCFVLSLLHLEALGRASVPKSKRKQFHIHCDEAHRFMTDSLEDLIAETRKYGVSLSVAHQYMSQFPREKTDALSSVGTTIIFKVNTRDAANLRKDLQNMVDVKDIVSLKVGEAIVRIENDILRVRTFPPAEIQPGNARDRIIEASRKKYYRPVHEVRKLIRQGTSGSDLLITQFTGPDGGEEEFQYDEF